jgi:hypothetical protein
VLFLEIFVFFFGEKILLRCFFNSPCRGTPKVKSKKKNAIAIVYTKCKGMGGGARGKRLVLRPGPSADGIAGVGFITIDS